MSETDARFLTLCPLRAGRAAQPPEGALVVVGGGSTPEGMHRKLLDLGGGTNANVLVIPFLLAPKPGPAPTAQQKSRPESGRP